MPEQGTRSSDTVSVFKDFGDRPFLRWAGGKQYLVRELIRSLPAQGYGRYYEPFLGAASLFLAAKPELALLSDLNSHLIDTYLQVRHAPEAVHRHLCEHARINSEDYYYSVRRVFNVSPPSPGRAAAFIYLNRAGYNGVFRVNLKGRYNVPYGHKRRVVLPALGYLLRLSEVLSTCRLFAADVSESIASARRGDFVYLDPPYPPLNGTAYFRHYTPSRFEDSDQVALAEAAVRLADRGCNVLITNAETPLIRRLYEGWTVSRVSANRHVTSKRHVHKVTELIITNY